MSRADLLEPGERVLAGAVGRDRQVVRVGRRGVVLERLVVRDVVVLVAPLAGAAESDADRVHRVAQRLVRRVRRDVLAGEAAPENSSGMNCAVGWPVWPVAADAVANVVVGRSRPGTSPTRARQRSARRRCSCRCSATASRVEQSSQYGCASLVSEKPPWPSGVMSPFGEVGVDDRRVVGLVRSCRRRRCRRRRG